jgi:hypothetical protein
MAASKASGGGGGGGSEWLRQELAALTLRVQRVVLAGAAGCKAQLGSRAAQAPRPEAEQTLRVVCMWTHPVRHAAAAYVC